MSVPPFFLCTVPDQTSLFDVYFDLDTNQWLSWSTLKHQLGLNENVQFKKKKNPASVFVSTLETVRMGYLIEAQIVSKGNVMVLGPTGTGKSWLTRLLALGFLEKQAS